MTDGQVAIDTPSVLRAWRRAGRTEIWLELRTDDGTIDDLYDATQAASTAHEGRVKCQFETESPRGFVTLIDRIVDDDSLAAWLDDLAPALEQRGVTGTLRHTTSAREPKWCRWDLFLPPVPSLFAAWTMDPATADTEPRNLFSWGVPPEPTEVILGALTTWAQPGGPRITIIREEFGVAVTDPQIVAPTITDAALSRKRTKVFFHDDKKKAARFVAQTLAGHTVHQILGGPDPWPHRIQALIDAVTPHAALLDQAFIRPARTTPPGWLVIGGAQPLPDLEEHHLHENRHLLDRYVPDAHGIQILTSDHLTRAHDLSDWDITDLGHDRHLVTAADLTPWYSDTLPHPDTVTHARHDFGPLILTQDTIATHPAPWLEP